MVALNLRADGSMSPEYTLYKEALDECVDKYYDDNPEFYDGQKTIFEENNNL